MTSQDNEVMEELLQEAKKLKLKGGHFCKTEKSLREMIQKGKDALEKENDEPVVAKTVDRPKRKPAPKMVVADVGKDAREALINRLEAEDPDCKYLFQPFSVTPEQLEAKHIERTEHKLGNEVVCRTDKAAYYEVIEARNHEQRRAMDAIDPTGAKIKSCNSQAKTLTTQ